MSQIMRHNRWMLVLVAVLFAGFLSAVLIGPLGTLQPAPVGAQTSRMSSSPENVTGDDAVNAAGLNAAPTFNCENTNFDFKGGVYGDTILNPGDDGANAAFRLPEGIDTSSVIDFQPMITLMDGWQFFGSWQLLGTQARHADIAGMWYLISPRINLFDVSQPITLTFEYDLDQDAIRGWVEISINGSGWVDLYPGPGQSLEKGSGKKAEVSLSDYAFSIIQLRWGLETTCQCGDSKVCGDCTNHFVVKNVEIKGGIGAEDGMGMEELEHRLYIADTGNHRVQIFEYESDGSTLTFKGFTLTPDDKPGSYGDGDGEFHLPEDVVVGPDAVVYVADTGNHRIEYFDADGNFLGQFGSYGDVILSQGDPAEDAEFNSPSGVAASAWHLISSFENGPDADYFFLYVADTGNHRVQRFKIEKNGGTPKYDGEWGYYGDADGEFNSPEGIDIDPIETPEDLGLGAPIPCELENWEARVYVADTNNHRVQSFSLQGDFKAKIGSYGDAIPSQGATTGVEFNSPQDVGVGIRLEGMLGFVQGCASRLVDLHVADTGNHRIMYLLRQEDADDHEFQNQFGRYGDEDGQFNSLAGIAADRLHPDDVGLESDIFTTDTWNHRYQRSSRQVGGGMLP